MRALRTSIALLVFPGAGLVSDYAQAFPDGAPWGAANRAAEQDCAACHFGTEPVVDSAALVLDGLPDTPKAGQTYALTLSFDHADIVIAGFQLIAVADDDVAGSFTASTEDVEFIGASIRSVMPSKGDGHAAWHFNWRAPDPLCGPVDFFLAASAANDDGSPFGDTIHFRTYRLPAR